MNANTVSKANINVKAAVWRWITRLFLLAITVFMLFPVVWNIYSSFKTNTEFLGNSFSLPKGFAWENYVNAFSKVNIGVNFMNSLYVVGIALIVIIICVIPCAYCLARYKFFGSRFMLGMYVTCIFVQASYIMIPLFLQMNSMGWREKLTPLAVLYAVTQFPFSIFLMTGFMRTIPREYEEAAMIDGCGNFRILTQVIAPMAKPGIVTVCMLSALAAWNEYPLALVMLTKDEKMTLPVGIADLYEVQRHATDWGALFAGLVVVLVPTIIMFAVGQRYLIQGISAGGIKG